MSIEVGHINGKHLSASDARLQRLFRRIAPWVKLIRMLVETELPGTATRVSTCFLVDDYFGDVPPPIHVIPDIVKVAKKYGIEIDYIARESACASAGDIELGRVS